MTLSKGTHKLDGNRQFEPIPARLRYFERHETVALKDGMKIHYLYDAPYDRATGSGHNKSISGAVVGIRNKARSRRSVGQGNWTAAS
jgi:hypothetical protein